MYPDISQEPKAFKYQQFWSKHTSFQCIVSRVWEKTIAGDGMFIVHCKLKEVRRELRRLNDEEFSNITSRLKEKHIEVEAVNARIYDGCLDAAQLAKATTLTKEYEQLCNAERQLYQSKETMQC
ncbi:hypothetical protein LIER_38389 [Lithospermum erythrorhizon]|uniref:Uncharacterized protein n=1 Tax=Lithospermum erythrorhizon TaxID=34254 RepID=A0AAV3PZE5_LITER